MIAVDGLSVQDIRARLSATLVGEQLYLFGEVDSTNTVACRLAREGAAEGTVVLADAQTDGQTGSGRRWFSPANVNVHASVIFRPALHSRYASRFALIASLALWDAITDLGLAPAIRWPNDILLSGKKVAATHADGSLRGHEIAHLVLGIGINVNVEPAALIAALGPAGSEATSLRAALGREVDRNGIAAAYLSRLDAWARRSHDDGPGSVVAAWQDRDVLTGRQVEVRGQQGALEGRVLGVNSAGHLLLDTSTGRRHVRAGQVIRILA